MSGNDLVDQMRSGAKPLPREPRQAGSVLDLVVMVAAAIAVVALGYFAASTWLGGSSTPPPAPAAMAQAAPSAPKVVWTDADTAACTKLARAEASAPDTGGRAITNPSITEGVAGLTTMVACQLTRKPARFCGPDGNAQLVALVSDYLTRMDLVKLGLGAQGAPMAIVGGLTGGEAEAGSAMYDEMARETIDYMASYDAHVLTAIHGLARNGVVTADAFKGLGGGVPKQIEKIFAGVQPKSNICA